MERIRLRIMGSHTAAMSYRERDHFVEEGLTSVVTEEFIEFLAESENLELEDIDEALGTLVLQQHEWPTPTINDLIEIDLIEVYQNKKQTDLLQNLLVGYQALVIARSYQAIGIVLDITLVHDDFLDDYLTLFRMGETTGCPFGAMDIGLRRLNKNK